MGASTVTVRCPACGQDLRAELAPGPPTQWFPCPNCHAPVPVVVPRDLPPLYSWEVVPGLYPTLPRPRRPRWRPRRGAMLALVGVVVFALALSGVLGYYAYAAAAPGSFEVSGSVYERSAGGTFPAVGALVVLTEDSGSKLTTTTGGNGDFAFSGVPNGGVSINVSAPGYAPVVVETFVSTVYNAGSQGLTFTLTPGGPGATTTTSLSAFPDLEMFLAAIGGAMVLLALVAVIAGLAAFRLVRADHPALGVVGGTAGLLAPAVLYFLGLGTVFPLLADATGGLAAFGAFALTVETIELARTGGGPTVG